jgi:hypothetical protein
LTDAEQYLRKILAKVPIVFFALDAQGRFTRSEGHALQKLGF